MTQTAMSGMDPDTVKRLISHIEKIENLEDEKNTTSELIKDEFTMAKSAGFDPKVMRIVLKMRKRDSDEIDEEQSLVDLYKTALGMH